MLWFKGGPPPQQYVTPHVPMLTPLPGGVFGLGQLFDHSGRGRELFWLSKVIQVYQATEAWPSPRHALQSLHWLTSMTTLSVESQSVTLTEVIAGCYSPTSPQSCRPLSSTLSTSSQHNRPPFYPSSESSAGWPISLLFRCFLLCFAHFDGCISVVVHKMARTRTLLWQSTNHEHSGSGSQTCDNLGQCKAKHAHLSTRRSRWYLVKAVGAKGRALEGADMEGGDGHKRNLGMFQLGKCQMSH